MSSPARVYHEPRNLGSRSSRRSVARRDDVNDQRSMSFRGGRNPSPNDVFIAVMGVTGSGKSSFISTCSGLAVKVGHRLEACTTTVDVYAYEVSPSHTVYLIDTPGFDDTNRSDTQVLREIAGWLGASYKHKILLHGIIYLHRITDIRMQGSAKKNLVMFRQLCGEEALKKVILVTTMWDKVPAEEGTRREQELINTAEFWGWMLGKGSTFHRHNNTEASARGIVTRLAGHKAPITTDLQRQLVDEHRSLDQTSAGRELQSEMLKEKAKWAQEKKEIEQQMHAAIKQHDRETEQIMREERDRYTKMIKKVENDTGTLRSTMNNLLAERDRRVARVEQQMKEQQAAHKAELERFSERQRRIEKEKAELEKQQRQREKEEQRRRQKEQERQEAQSRREENEQQQAQQRQQAQAPTPNTELAPYSLTMANGRFMSIGPKLITSNYNHPRRKEGSATAVAVSVGEVDSDNARAWVAGYSDGIWYKSLDFARMYPNLAAYLDERGLNNLALCSLGPGSTYYARWRDGRWMSWASEEINTAISEAQSNGKHVKAIALGCGGSYVISFGSRSGTSWINLGVKWNLKGYYPDLRQFLGQKIQTTSITAIALDMSNGTDYQMVYQHDRDDTKIKFRKIVSYANVESSINNWWLKS
ncbi:hypothetical protein BDV12DRAFT_194266 [Aspergillus spectabilis]